MLNSRRINIRTAIARAALYGLWSFLFLACSLPSTTWSAEFPSVYDGLIKSAVGKWWIDYPDWTILKAQYWQESHLDPTARSGVGAEGIAQFMGPSWNDMIRSLNYPKISSRQDAALAIEAGAYYMRNLRATWKRNRTPSEAHDPALGSYNAGTKRILDAQALCDNARLWQSIAPCLIRVTGEANAKQTSDYVRNIHRWRNMMEIDP